MKLLGQVVKFKGADGLYTGLVVRETTLFLYAQLLGYPNDVPSVKVPKTKCKVL